MVPAYADVTQTADGSTNYIVKPLEIEQTMKKASSASVCTDAGTDAGLAFGDISLPDESGYTAPDMDCNASCRRSSSCRGRGKNVNPGSFPDYAEILSGNTCNYQNPPWCVSNAFCNPDQDCTFSKGKVGL